MFLQMNYMPLYGIHCMDTRRLLELNQYQYLMEKRRQLFPDDRFEPLRRLGNDDKESAHGDKRLTSFRISDILSSASEESVEPGSSKKSDERSQRKRKSLDSGVLPHSVNNKQRKVSTGASRPDSFERDSDETSQESVVRPWNISSRLSSSHTNINLAERRSSADNDFSLHISPKYSTQYLSPSKSFSATSSTSPTNGFSINSAASDSLKTSAEHARDIFLRFCAQQGQTYDIESESDEEIDVEGCDDVENEVTLSKKERGDVSPLDALVAMSSKAFVGLESFEERQKREHEEQNKNQLPKKKRKTRTAFTNQQIYELEKRFVLQKYLTPSDRDEIAGKLGLTCAQVITWFQNRRAKFKRDIEELKQDVVATSPPRTRTES
ncbi:homeobox protein Hox-B10a-like [Mya arenaria]|uniref:homeobox protein Hox-B10a-like n=1 Tax=Mya arenaria TaxID=6604 RepID=UPI0022E90DF7|nr:homeobox protein Hox-B10a-like [Mya arenaria]